MLFLRNQKKILLVLLGLFLVAGVYQLALKGADQTRLQKYKQYYFGFLNDMVFYMEKKLDEEHTDSNDAIEDENDKLQHVNETGKSGQSSFDKFLGDKYVVDDTTPQTRCPSSIRNRVMHTEFAKVYLSSVPVLQWAKHFSKAEYERLAQYTGANGWGSVSIDVLNESLAILNTSANREMFDDWKKRNSTLSCIRCAVVGNAGILNNSRKGQEIDANDYVFRTNGAIIKGFEQDVGSRTSFYTFSTNTFRNSLRSYKRAGYKGAPMSPETRYIFLPDHDRDYILMRAASLRLPILKGKDRSSKPPTYFGTDVTVKKFKMYHPDFIRYIRNRFLHSRRLKSKQRNIYRPSTGAVMLLSALHTCDEVNAYGFMTPDFRKYSDHYYDKTFHKVHFFANHDLRIELNLWQRLHNAGLMKLYMRP